MAVRRLVILKRVGKTPIFAECEQCHFKFFTPRDLERDSLGAEERMQDKFDTHRCKNPRNAGPRGVKPIDDRMKTARS